VFCTVALARYLGVPVPEALEAELAAADGWFERTVVYLQPLGFIRRTAVRRISYADSLSFGELHREVYAQHGFGLVEIPPGEPEHRAAVVRDAVGL
jgi:predicted ATPase